jgi:hypothetical protein
MLHFEVTFSRRFCIQRPTRQKWPRLTEAARCENHKSVSYGRSLRLKSHRGTYSGAESVGWTPWNYEYRDMSGGSMMSRSLRVSGPSSSKMMLQKGSAAARGGGAPFPPATSQSVECGPRTSPKPRLGGRPSFCHFSETLASQPECDGRTQSRRFSLQNLFKGIFGRVIMSRQKFNENTPVR